MLSRMQSAKHSLSLKVRGSALCLCTFFFFSCCRTTDTGTTELCMRKVEIDPIKNLKMYIAMTSILDATEWPTL